MDTAAADRDHGRRMGPLPRSLVFPAEQVKQIPEDSVTDLPLTGVLGEQGHDHRDPDVHHEGADDGPDRPGDPGGRRIHIRQKADQYIHQ
ncbi:MAG: hypothetical protein ACRDP6_05430 [Actinoallomurus sp.]